MIAIAVSKNHKTLNHTTKDFCKSSFVAGLISVTQAKRMFQSRATSGYQKHSNPFNHCQVMKNLEIEFVLERERRYLRENPTQAIALVLSYLEDFLHLSKEFKVLEQKYQSAITKWHCAIADNQKLTSQLIEMSNPTRADKYVKRKRNVSSSGVKLPSFLACHRH